MAHSVPPETPKPEKTPHQIMDNKKGHAFSKSVSF